MTAKQQVSDILEQLPDSCTLEDIQYRLYVIQTIQRRLELAKDGSNLVSQENARQQLGKWLKK